MRCRAIALCSVLFSIAAFSMAAHGEEAKNDVKGLFLLSDYPAVTLRPGTTSTINLRVQNYALPPERLALSVSGVPSGWTASLLGGGQPVAAAMPSTNSSVSIELRVDVPKDAPVGTTNLTVNAQGPTVNASLPVAVTLATDLPAKLALNPQLPELRGTSKSNFEFQLGIKNDSGKKVTVSLSAQAPPNFDATFTEQYGSQELNALPLDPGQSKDVKLKVRPPNTVAAGKYKVNAKATAEDASASSELVWTLPASPRSTSPAAMACSAGVPRPARRPRFRSSSPIPALRPPTRSNCRAGPSGWKVNFEPKTLDRIAPNENKEVQALITPTAKAIAGRLRHDAAVRTSRGANRLLADLPRRGRDLDHVGHRRCRLIGGALLVLVGAVAWFGRR
jgi:uncharacterized membrane protein